MQYKISCNFNFSISILILLYPEYKSFYESFILFLYNFLNISCLYILKYNKWHLKISINNNRYNDVCRMSVLFIYLIDIIEINSKICIIHWRWSNTRVDICNTSLIYIGLHMKHWCWLTLAYPPTSMYLFFNLFEESYLYFLIYYLLLYSE